MSSWFLSVPRTCRRFAGGLFLGVSLSCVGLVSGAEEGVISNQVARPLQAVQEHLKASRFKEALVKLAEIDAMAGLGDYEKFVVERMRGVAAVGAQDQPGAIAALTRVLEARKLPAAEQQQMNELLVSSCFVARDYACVERWAGIYAEQGGGKPEVALRRAQAAYLAADYALAGELAGRLVAADLKAGRQPALDVLQLQASCFVKAKNHAAYRAVLEQTLAYYPTPEGWSNLVYGLMQQAGFPRKLELDGYRLLLAADGLAGGDEYLDMAEAAIKAGFPLEAVKSLDKGEAAGKLSGAAERARHQEMRGRLAKLVADDQKAIAQTDNMLAKAKDGNLFVGLGLNLVLAGQQARGLSLIEQGIGRGVGGNADQARLHLAYAQWLSGMKDEAATGFAANYSPGAVADLARYWRLLIAK